MVFWSYALGGFLFCFFTVVVFGFGFLGFDRFYVEGFLFGFAWLGVAWVDNGVDAGVVSAVDGALCPCGALAPWFYGGIVERGENDVFGCCGGVDIPASASL